MGKHVAILGLGPSVDQFVRITRGMGGASAFCDEVWTINALGDIIQSDLIFHMDDVRVQMARAKAAPDSNIAHMVAWLKTTKTRVVTSCPHPDFPTLEAFPLARAIELCPKGYFNSTAAYAIAYAILAGVGKMTVFGMDFTYPDAHDAERGRACVEFWLGVAASRGIELAMPKTSSLMDALYPQDQRFYGYDCVELAITRKKGRIKVAMKERAKVPTAEEIEERYDHTRHPNALVEGPG